IAVDAPKIALAHVTLIDGTGAPALNDQTVVIDGGKIVSVGAAADAKVPADARVLALEGATLIPGIVGMHDHLFMSGRPYGSSPTLSRQAVNAARLSLASGVTTIRTAGSVSPASDLNLKHLIDAGKEAGPRIFVTGPYLEGEGGPFLDMLVLR